MEKQKPSGSPAWTRGKCIGRGSFGTVSLAVSHPDGRAFAVKSVNLSSCFPSHLDSLEKEIRILPSLSLSPFIVEYLGDDVTADSGTASFRNLHMEYLPAGTAADLAAAAAADLDERLLKSCTWCVVSALSYLHSKKIVHCDVKGKNVLIANAATGAAKLADFGSALEISGQNAGIESRMRGSPLWMAPEVVRGERQGPESDVWSLGCTVIEMVTGEPAWKDRGGADTLRRIGFSDELPEYPPKLSKLGRDFLDKCLRRNPEERWSCYQLLQHPFLDSVSASKINDSSDSSPRCVLDWVNSDFSNDDEEEDQIEIEKSSVWARGRIGELASTRGAIWESEGWESVRGGGGYGGCSDNRAYAEDASVEAESCCGTSLAYSEKKGVLSETHESSHGDRGGDGGDGGGGLSWSRHGVWLFDNNELAVDRPNIRFYSWCIFVLSYYCCYYKKINKNYKCFC